MANKYIIEGATYCGDGTASNEAASAGAAGAWNDINVFEGTAPAYGTAPAAGDVVYIRSKTNAGADITRTLTVDITIGSANATITNPVTWVLDNGAIWSGIDGKLRYQCSGGNYKTTVRSYNAVIAQTQSALEFVTSNTYGSAWTVLFLFAGVYMRGPKVDAAAWGKGYTPKIVFSGSVLEDLEYVTGDANSGSIFEASECMYSVNTVVNPKITINGSNTGGEVVRPAPYLGEGDFTIYGGRIDGTATNVGFPLTYSASGGSAGAVRFVGTKIPRTMVLSATRSTMHDLEIIGCDDDGTGGYLERGWGWATSRTDNYPPTLSATLPDADLTPWAWRVYPRDASIVAPMAMTTTKLFADTEATKTITQEILVANTMAPTKRTLWMTVEYIDAATGAPKHGSTQVITGGALDSSTANWSSDTWGMIGLNKRKFTFTTPTSIKQNTLITVTLFGTLKSASANDIYFVDPDFGVN